MEHENWWDRRRLLSVDHLRLWDSNPRLDPTEKHIRIYDFIEDLISSGPEKEGFISLVKSIATSGFISIEPVVVWQDESGKFIVAEGNRRVLALKLLRNPTKAPKEVRSIISKYAALIDRESIEKIKVCLAPSLESCRWYILQRHSTSSTQRPWERLQQQRFIVDLCDKYNNDIEKILEVTSFSRQEINNVLRFVKIRDLAEHPLVINEMTKEERDEIISHRIPMTIIERWFNSKDVREKWGITFENSDIKFTSDPKSFLQAYAKFLKLIFNPNENGLKLFKVNTRSIPERNDEIFEVLPPVLIKESQEPIVVDFSNIEKSTLSESANDDVDEPTQNSEQSSTSTESEEEPARPPLQDPKRGKLVTEFTTIDARSFKLQALVGELKRVPTNRYRNVVAATLRIVLDLSVNEYISATNLREKICTERKCGFERVTLKEKLSYLQKNNHLTGSAVNPTQKLLNPSNEHSLDTLNNYIHGVDTHKTNVQFLNGFWDMLVPIFNQLVGLEER